MDDLRGRSSRRNRLAIVAVLTVVAFAVTLALVIGHRLSDEALAVLAGAVCGVGAAIPTSLLVVVVSRRRDERGQPPVQQGPYPPVVVVAPPGGRQLSGDWSAFSSSLTAPMERQFTVVGEGQKAQRVDAEVKTYGRYS
jgi:hypothetical protein